MAAIAVGAGTLLKFVADGIAVLVQEAFGNLAGAIMPGRARARAVIVRLFAAI